MEKYLGVKLIEAEPSSLDQFAGAKNFGDLSKLSGGVDREGYKVVYENGYTSWSPKDVFEDSYRQIKLLEDVKFSEQAVLPHQQRVINEMEELDIKIVALDKFILESPIYKTLPKDEQSRLVLQVRAMQYYFTILVERINNF